MILCVYMQFQKSTHIDYKCLQWFYLLQTKIVSSVPICWQAYFICLFKLTPNEEEKTYNSSLIYYTLSKFCIIVILGICLHMRKCGLQTPRRYMYLTRRPEKADTIMRLGHQAITCMCCCTAQVSQLKISNASGMQRLSVQRQTTFQNLDSHVYVMDTGLAIWPFPVVFMISTFTRRQSNHGCVTSS